MQRGLDQIAGAYGLGQSICVELIDACPQGDVRTRRLLRLEPADTSDDGDGIGVGALRERLPDQQSRG
jgi:hypothetical protein